MVLNLKCPSCGGVAVMDKETGKIKCTQCGQVLNVGAGGSEENSAMVRTEDGTLVDKRSYRNIRKAARIRRYITEPADTVYTPDEMNRSVDKDSPKHMSMDVYECNSCGARLMVKPTEASSFCAYCGQPMVLTDKVSDELQPDVIIPFSVSKQRAEALIRERFCQGRFVPREIKNFRVDKLREMYIPYFLTTVQVRKKLKYTVEEHVRESPSFKYEGIFSDTKWDDDGKKIITHHCMKDCECMVSRVPGEASSKLNDAISQRLEPYDMSRLIDFSPEYLSGCYADRYDVQPDALMEMAKRRADYMLGREMLSDVGKKDIVKIASDNTELKLVDVEYALLPAWFVTFTYKGVYYTAAVNGQTGKVIGNVPADRAKMGAAVCVLIVIMAAVCSATLVFLGNLVFTENPDQVTYYAYWGIFVVCSVCAGYFSRGLSRLKKSRIDLKKFRSRGVIEYVNERQDKTWYRR